jgi:hypothetical protein
VRGDRIEWVARYGYYDVIWTLALYLFAEPYRSDIISPLPLLNHFDSLPNCDCHVFLPFDICL